jgi:hypothetical protein
MNKKCIFFIEENKPIADHGDEPPCCYYVGPTDIINKRWILGAKAV